MFSPPKIVFPIVFGTEIEWSHPAIPAIESPIFVPAHLKEIYAVMLSFIREKYKPFCRKDMGCWDRPFDNQFTEGRVRDLLAAIKQNNQDFKPADHLMMELGLWMKNGSRIYVDDAHLESSIAECAHPKTAVLQEKAAELIIDEARIFAEEELRRNIVIHKNNSDGKNNSYACHKNFLLKRPFFDYLTDEEGDFSEKKNNLRRIWASFLSAGIIIGGAGKVGSEEKGEPCDYQISARADFIHHLFGIITTAARALINLRDEPLADHFKYGRLHVIGDDSNMSEWQIYLGLGLKALVLKMLETWYFEGRTHDDSYKNLVFANPVSAVHEISRDLTCLKPVKLVGGKAVSPIEFLESITALAGDFYANLEKNHWAWDVLEKTNAVLNWLKNDDERLNAVLDWRLKKSIIESFLAKRRSRGENANWQNPLVKNIDIKYHEIGAGGLYNKFSASGSVERLATDEEIVLAKTEPPPDTRAKIRSDFIKLHDDIEDVWWSFICFRDELKHSTSKCILEPIEPLLL